MSRIVKRYSPNFLLNIFKYISLIVNYMYDLNRYFKYSDSPRKKSTISHLKSRMTENYHALEKGLSLKDVRLGFGRERIDELIDIMNLYIEKNYDVKNYVFNNCILSLKEYEKFHINKGYDVDFLTKKLTAFEKHVNSLSDTGGTIYLEKAYLIGASQKDFQSLAVNRHSIRNFCSSKVNLEKIKKSIDLAGRSPSACNKQPTRVYIVRGKELLTKALKNQSGNSGFGHLADLLLIVTYDIENFNGAKNRNQGFIDGGMYSMSLIYALQYYGLGACALNWAADKKQDKSLRKDLNIKNSENIIMMIVVGNLPENLRVPKSLRLHSNDVVKHLNS